MKKEIFKTLKIYTSDIFYADLDSVIKYLSELNFKYNKANLNYEGDIENLEITLDYWELESDKEYEERLQKFEQNKKEGDLLKLDLLQKEIEVIKQRYGL